MTPLPPDRCRLDQIRIGIIGLGHQGSLYSGLFVHDAIPGARLTAICVRQGRTASGLQDIALFTDANAMIRSGCIDAVIIATPHPSHADLAILAIHHGLHVLIDKPMASQAADCARITAAHEQNGHNSILAIMHHQRFDPRYRRLSELLASGQCGRTQRFAWTVTDWFRTDAYFASAPWRGTWTGEHGGLLINQCPHQLDLLHWFFGRPSRVQATCRFGAHHPIQTEDEVHALFAYEDGMLGTFTASSGEAPGINRLEIATDRGLITVDPQGLAWNRTRLDVAACRRSSSDPMPTLASELIAESYSDSGPFHLHVLRNFVESCRGLAAPLAPKATGAHAVELANALLLSSWEGRWVDLPLDAGYYATELSRRCAADR
jgi:predicted dehydrogenase